MRALSHARQGLKYTFKLEDLQLYVRVREGALCIEHAWLLLKRAPASAGVDAGLARVAGAVSCLCVSTPV